MVLREKIEGKGALHEDSSGDLVIVGKVQLFLLRLLGYAS